MIFSTADYVGFLLIVLMGYVPLNAASASPTVRLVRNAWLLAASYLFYASWSVNLLWLIVGSTALNYLVGRAVAHRRSRALVAACVTVNLGALAYFKYAGFFVEMASALVPISSATHDFVATIVLPVGISFYTFQALAYVIDVSRGEVAAERNPIDFALYIAFFPQLVAGPIERAQTLMPQIRSRRPITLEHVTSGLWLFYFGLFKKRVVADNMQNVVNTVFAANSAPSGAEIVLGTLAFSIQVYADFSGYTDMARGSARLLGFELRLNFRAPYFAINPSDLWRRWHISLYTWLRDYLYIPLGGRNKGGRNMMITMTLGGLWHGAGWNFIGWGAFHGLMLAAHAWLRSRVRLGPRAAMWIGIPTTFAIFNIGLFIFRTQADGQFVDYCTRLVTVPLHGNERWTAWAIDFVLFGIPILIFQYAAFRTDREIPIFGWPWPIRALVYFVMALMLCQFVPEELRAFFYFQF